jgi:hypothetical protein
MKSVLLKFYLLCIIVVIQKESFTQTWIQIPDTNFGNRLSIYFPSATMIIDGEYFINSESDSVQNQTHLYVSDLHIISLEGIEVFSSLTYLNCSYNFIQVLPTLPPLLTTLICNHNKLNSLPDLPSSLTRLECYFNFITHLPPLPENLITLKCEFNSITHLPNLPQTLHTLVCNHNQISFIPFFPVNLFTFYGQENLVVCFPTFPSSIVYVNISNNLNTCVPNYVAGLDSQFPICEVDSLFDCNVSTANNPNIKIQNVIIAPNPTHGVFSISFTKNGFQKVIITDFTGKLILEKVTNCDTLLLDLSYIESGTYILNVISDDEYFTSEKLIIQ